MDDLNGGVYMRLIRKQQMICKHNVFFILFSLAIVLVMTSCSSREMQGTEKEAKLGIETSPTHIIKEKIVPTPSPTIRSVDVVVCYEEYIVPLDLRVFDELGNALPDVSVGGEVHGKPVRRIGLFEQGWFSIGINEAGMYIFKIAKEGYESQIVTHEVKFSIDEKGCEHYSGDEVRVTLIELEEP